MAAKEKHPAAFRTAGCVGDLFGIYDLIDAANRFPIGAGDDLYFFYRRLGISRKNLDRLGAAVVLRARNPCGTGPAEPVDLDGV